MKKIGGIWLGILAGAGAGVFFSALSLFRFNFSFLEPVMNFVAAPTSLIGARLGVSGNLAYPIFILYFSIVGFITSWILSARFKFKWVMAVLFLAFVGFLHWEAMQQLERDFAFLYSMFHNPPAAQ